MVEPIVTERTAAETAAIDFLRRVARNDAVRAAEQLDAAIDSDGVGAIAEAFADVCRSLMDRVAFSGGTVDVHAVVDEVATRVVATAGDDSPDAVDRQRSLLVFLGSEGLPCAARADVATWFATDRLRALVACAIGLVGIVAEDEGIAPVAAVETITRPRPARPASGTFGLAWRGPEGVAEPFAGVVPRGYTAHITFVGSERCSLRSIFARVALLRHAPLSAPATLPAALRSS
jgi:hypothetical protein